MKLSEQNRNYLEIGMKAIALLDIILCFLPICQFSFLGFELSFSQLNLAFGKEWQGQEVIEGNFICIFLLLIPVAILLALQFVKENNTVKYGTPGVLSIIKIILLAVSLSEAEKTGYGLIDMTFWTYLVYILLAVLVLASLLLLLSKSENVEKDMKLAVGQMMKTAATVSSKITTVLPKRTCQNCGAELDSDCTYCPKCGEKYVEPVKRTCSTCGAILADGDAFCRKCGTKYTEPVVRKCPNCGQTNSEDAMFCEKCGTKLE